MYAHGSRRGSELLGLHHIHVRAPDPDEVFRWMLAKFGGARSKLKGRIDGLKYSAPGFSSVWILAQRGESEPSEGHTIDHIGFRSTALWGRPSRDCAPRV
jgi:hypothetical protein